ncbi:MAG TPA: hypothetical protein VEB21_10045 [Terriglobales bacterium]|nr:hypothetical protein [Terriglobales bacterium]
MARYTTGEETEAEYIAAMGAELGAVFYRLFNDTGTLHILWDQFVILFATKRERLSILNRSAGTFFRLVQNMLWQHTLLTLCRLTDPKTTAGKANLSIRCIPDLVNDAALREELGPLIEAAVEATNFARDWRNRRIAHTDFDLFAGRSAKELASASKTNVEHALAAIAAVLSHLEQRFKGRQLWFGNIPHAGGAEAMLYVLREGLEAEERRRQRLKDGSCTLDDLAPPRDL